MSINHIQERIERRLQSIIRSAYLAVALSWVGGFLLGVSACALLYIHH